MKTCGFIYIIQADLKGEYPKNRNLMKHFSVIEIVKKDKPK